MALDELAASLRRVTVDTNPPATRIRHFTEISELAAFIRRTNHALDEADHHARRAARKLSCAVTEITRVLGLIRAGQILIGATCPWCRGVTPKHPAGGATTMRVEEVGGSKHLNIEPVPAVVCWNPLCTPPDADCGTWHRGRPAWPWHEWDWLAKRLAG